MSELYLIHWGLGKGKARKDHQYVMREFINGKWKYWYEEDLEKNPGSATDNKATLTQTRNKEAKTSKTYIDFHNGNGVWSDKVGIIRSKAKGKEYLSFFDTRNRKYFENDEDASKINKKLGPFSVSYADDGVEYKLDISAAKKPISDLKASASKAGKSIVDKFDSKTMAKIDVKSVSTKTDSLKRAASGVVDKQKRAAAQYKERLKRENTRGVGASVKTNAITSNRPKSSEQERKANEERVKKMRNQEARRDAQMKQDREERERRETYRKNRMGGNDINKNGVFQDQERARKEQSKWEEQMRKRMGGR